MRTTTPALAALLFPLAGALAACTSPPTTIAAGEPPTSDASGPYNVTRVIDGDTITIDQDGRPTTVRLIGIDTPETKHPDKGVECYGPEASERMRDLVDSKSVWLEQDSTQDATDAYGRTLAYVWTSPKDLVNEQLITAGAAREYTYDMPYEHQDRFRDAQQKAITTQAGQWSPDTCNAKP